MTTLSKSLGLSSSLKEEAMVSKKQGIVSILGSDSERGKSAAPIRRTLSADMSSKQWLSQHGFSPLKKIASSDQFPAVFSSSDPPSSSSSEGEEEYEEFRQGRGGQFDIWTSIHEEEEEEEENKKKQQQQKKKEAEFSDIWSAIVSQKAQEDPKNLPPPYIHPLVKRTASSLSEKSLAICTESLGSETGSDGFSSYPPSDNGDAENDDKEEGQQGQEQDRPAQSKHHMEDLHVVQYNNLAATSSKKSPPRSFPPPIPSLSNRGGASVHMKSHRDNGRLVLEAVSVPSQNNFRAQRQDGRLVLTLINRPDEAELAAEKKQEEEKNDVEVEQFEVEMENSKVHGDEVEKEEEEEEEEENESGRGGGDGGWKEDVRFVMEEAPKFTSNGVIKLHRLALMINTNRPMVLSNRNPTTTTTTTISTTSWRNKFNEMVEFEIEEEEEEDEEEEEQEVLEPIAPLTQSLPPRPPMAARMIPKPTLAASSVATAKAAASLNAYEYYWRPKPMSAAEAGATALHSLTQKQPRINNNTNSSNKFILSKKRMTNDDQQELLVFKGNNGDNYLVPLAKSCKVPRKPLLFWDPCCIATS